MDKTTENIIQTAFNKFIQFGIRNISIEDICNELHISKKTFYTVFPSKEDLVEAVVEFHLHSGSVCFEKIYANKNAIDALIAIIKEIRKKLDKEPATFYYDLEKYYPTIFEKHKDFQRVLIQKEFERNLLRGIEEGYYREDMDVEIISVFHSIQRFTFSKMKSVLPKTSKKQLMDFYIDLIIRLITNEKGYKYITDNY